MGARATIRFVAAPDWEALRRRLHEGVVIFDLEALEDADAARALADGLRARVGPDQPLECWLRPAPLETAARAVEAATLLTSALPGARSPCNRVWVAEASSQQQRPAPTDARGTKGFGTSAPRGGRAGN